MHTHARITCSALGENEWLNAIAQLNTLAFLPNQNYCNIYLILIIIINALFFVYACFHDSYQGEILQATANLWKLLHD